MKAVFITENGDISRLNYGDLPAPTPAAGEVLVNVRAAALNHLDIRVRRGGRAAPLQSAHILGSDASGTIAALGAGVSGMAVDDEIILNPGLSCGHCEYCLRGEQSQCFTFGIMGMSRPGTFAEQVSVPAVNIYPKPAHLSFEEAAALPLAYLTAWRMLINRGGLTPGDTVLLHGIGGGVAIAALQFCALTGARAIVTSSSDDKLARAKQLGATHGVNYTTTPDVAAEIKRLTHDRGVDLIIDSVGGATWPINFGCIRRGGRIVICGVTGGAEVTANLSQLYWNHVSVIGSTMGASEDFRGMVNAVAAAGIKPVIDATYPLSDAKTAQARMEAGEQFGKLVLVV